MAVNKYRVTLEYYDGNNGNYLFTQKVTSDTDQITVNLQAYTEGQNKVLKWKRQDTGASLEWIEVFAGAQVVEDSDPGAIYYITALDWEKLYGLSLIFDANGGSGAPEPLGPKYSEEQQISFTLPPTEPVLDHHIFLGWALSESTENIYGSGDTYTGTGSKDEGGRTDTLIARWKEIPPYKATIYLNPNGGILVETEYLYNESYETDQLTFILPTPQLTGQSFNGWLDSNSGKIYSSGVHTFTGSQEGKSYTLIAQWKPLIIYTYNFYFYDQSAEKLLFSDEETSAFKTISYNIEYTQPEVEFYEFYWYNSNFGYVKPGQTISVSIEDGNIAQDYYFTAIYIPITYKVTVELDVNEGTLPPDVNPILKEEARGTNQVSITLPTPERPGYNFLNWAGNNTFYSAGTHNFTGSESGETYKLVATWKPKVLYKATVIFSPNGGIGEPVVSTQSSYDTSIFYFEVPQAPEREQHDFMGWATSPDAEVGKDLGDTITLEGSTDSNGAFYYYYAIWKKFYEVTIIYNDNVDEEIISVPDKQYIKNYNESIDIILSSQKPQRQNYAFLGWGTNQGATKPTYSAGQTLQDFKLGEVGYTFNLYAVWRQDGIVNIFINNNWVQAIPYIYDGSEWKQVIPYVYESNNWHITT